MHAPTALTLILGTGLASSLVIPINAIAKEAHHAEVHHAAESAAFRHAISHYDALEHEIAHALRLPSTIAARSLSETIPAAYAKYIAVNGANTFEAHDELTKRDESEFEGLTREEAEEFAAYVAADGFGSLPDEDDEEIERRDIQEVDEDAYGREEFEEFMKNFQSSLEGDGEDKAYEDEES